MSDVVRHVRGIEEVIYTLGRESVRRAILSWLYDTQDGAFNEETELQFCEGGSAVVTTRFASADTRPAGGDATEIAAPFTSGAGGRRRRTDAMTSVRNPSSTPPPEPTDAFPPPPDGHEAILDEQGNDTGYRREIATGTIFTIDEEGDEP
jgi:hypothetical protein